LTTHYPAVVARRERDGKLNSGDTLVVHRDAHHSSFFFKGNGANLAQPASVLPIYFATGHDVKPPL
jgi:hypothetical protein